MAGADTAGQAQGRSRILRFGTYIGDHAVAAAFALIVTIITPFVTNLLAIEDGQIATGTNWRRLTELSGPDRKPIRVEGEGLGSAGDLVGPVDSALRRDLAFSDPPEGLAVRYRLSGLQFAGTQRRARLEWHVKGQNGWAECGPRDLRFTNNASLGPQVSEIFRRSVEATISKGSAQCD